MLSAQRLGFSILDVAAPRVPGRDTRYHREMDKGTVVTNSALRRQAKAGDASAIDELVERSRGRVQSEVVAAVGALGTVGTPAGNAALAKIIVESKNSGARFVAARLFRHQLRRDRRVRELLVQMCQDRRVDADDLAIPALAELVEKDRGLARDPRVRKAFRRALRAANESAQASAVLGLIAIGDKAALGDIVRLLDGKRLGGDLAYYVGQAAIKLDGGAKELAKIEKRRAKARRDVAFGLDRAIKKLRQRVKTRG